VQLCFHLALWQLRASQLPQNAQLWSSSGEAVKSVAACCTRSQAGCQTQRSTARAARGARLDRQRHANTHTCSAVAGIVSSPQLLRELACAYGSLACNLARWRVHSHQLHSDIDQATSQNNDDGAIVATASDQHLLATNSCVLDGSVKHIVAKAKGWCADAGGGRTWSCLQQAMRVVMRDVASISSTTRSKLRLIA